MLACPHCQRGTVILTEEQGQNDCREPVLACINCARRFGTVVGRAKPERRTREPIARGVRL